MIEIQRLTSMINELAAVDDVVVSDMGGYQCVKSRALFPSKQELQQYLKNIHGSSWERRWEELKRTNRMRSNKRFDLLTPVTLGYYRPSTFGMYIERTFYLVDSDLFPHYY